MRTSISNIYKEIIFIASRKFFITRYASRMNVHTYHLDSLSNKHLFKQTPEMKIFFFVNGYN